MRETINGKRQKRYDSNSAELEHTRDTARMMMNRCRLITREKFFGIGPELGISGFPLGCAVHFPATIAPIDVAVVATEQANQMFMPTDKATNMGMDQ